MYIYESHTRFNTIICGTFFLISGSFQPYAIGLPVRTTVKLYYSTMMLWHLVRYMYSSVATISLLDVAISVSCYLRRLLSPVVIPGASSPAFGVLVWQHHRRQVVWCQVSFAVGNWKRPRARLRLLCVSPWGHVSSIHLVQIVSSSFNSEETLGLSEGRIVLDNQIIHRT